MENLGEFIGNHPLLFAAAAVTLALIFWTEFGRLTRKYRDLAPNELVQLINRDKAVVVDVREDSETRKGTIVGAKRLPASVFRQRMEDLDKFRDHMIVVCCQSGTRSPQLCEMLVKAGFPSVAQIKGGMAAWESAGLPLKGK